MGTRRGERGEGKRQVSEVAIFQERAGYLRVSDFPSLCLSLPAWARAERAGGMSVRLAQGELPVAA